ncbi:unnamed protein product [Microthlaspi erraticum]|uniref:Arabidopsis retrotransposon Orf1 C-terminal domain-containing protein n=1 Tax=Microthlaspi erraticum TaxID=1685480 RepID=A0A6D2K728_9BRAS|nr:unnamed protein product [Microthlaspi erraticum]
MRDAPFPETPGDDETEDAVTAEEMQRFRTLLDMRFAGTRYADRGTMQTLRIDEDIDEMFQNLGIHRLMFQQYESYRKATCLFLATLEHKTCDPGTTTPDGSDGYITFWATKQTAGLKAAHQHISILQRWNKAQDKITNKLKSKEVSTGPQSVHARRSPLRTTTSPTTTPPADDHCLLSHHDTLPSSRDSSGRGALESRRQRDHQAQQLGRLAIQAMQLHFEADSADRPHTADESSAGPVRALHHERAAPTTVPTYTQESMQEDLDDFIYGRR